MTNEPASNGWLNFKFEYPILKNESLFLEVRYWLFLVRH